MTDSVETFADLQLSSTLLATLAEVGYETPSPIQARCIPLLLAGHDLLGQAQTGTGKTAAFALPLLQKLNLNSMQPQVLVLTPTRELAIQVAEAFQNYARHLAGFHVLPIYGGQSMVVQLRQLQRGAQVIVGTPGRIMDHLERRSLNLDALSAVVLDEADEMLRMGFIDDVEWILQHVPAQRQTALFSATMPEPIRRVAHQYLRDPQEVKIHAATSTVATITQRYWQVRGVNKLDALTRILEAEEDLDAAIVFVRTKTATTELADRLAARGHAAAAINGDMTQALRERAIEQLKAGTLDILVATDVAARGIDVPRVSHVINYDIPYDTEAYVHRIGRTGRAGRAGNAILFVAPREQGMLRAIERATRQPITPISLPTREALVDRRVAELKQCVLDAIEAEDMDFFSTIIDELEDVHDLPIRNIAAALLYLAQRERPLQVEESGGGWDVATTAPVPQGRPVDRARQERPRHEPGARGATVQRNLGEGRLVRYRIEVGRNHQVTPREIVGAIANEGGIEGRQIGQIDLFDDYSTVELPALPPELLAGLRRTRVRQLPLNIRPLMPGEGDVRPVSRSARDQRQARPAVDTPIERGRAEHHRETELVPGRVTRREEHAAYTRRSAKGEAPPRPAFGAEKGARKAFATGRSRPPISTEATERAARPADRARSPTDSRPAWRRDGPASATGKTPRRPKKI